MPDCGAGGVRPVRSSPAVATRFVGGAAGWGAVVAFREVIRTSGCCLLNFDFDQSTALGSKLPNASSRTGPEDVSSSMIGAGAIKLGAGGFALSIKNCFIAVITGLPFFHKSAA